MPMERIFQSSHQAEHPRTEEQEVPGSVRISSVLLLPPADTSLFDPLDHLQSTDTQAVIQKSTASDLGSRATSPNCQPRRTAISKLGAEGCGMLVGAMALRRMMDPHLTTHPSTRSLQSLCKCRFPRRGRLDSRIPIGRSPDAKLELNGSQGAYDAALANKEGTSANYKHRQQPKRDKASYVAWRAHDADTEVGLRILNWQITLQEHDEPVMANNEQRCFLQTSDPSAQAPAPEPTASFAPERYGSQMSSLSRCAPQCPHILQSKILQPAGAGLALTTDGPASTRRTADDFWGLAVWGRY